MSEEIIERNLRKELEENYRGFIQAVKTKDIRAMAQYYCHDCHLIFQGGPKVSGREQAIQILEPILDNLVDFNITIKDVYQLSDNSAIEIGENTVIEEINGQIKTTHGRYVAQWEKQPNGLWQAKIDIGLEY